MGPLLSWTADETGAITWVSPALPDATCTESAAWLGSKWLDLVHFEDLGRVSTAWRRAVQSQSAFDDEYRLTTAQGVVWVRSVAQRGRQRTSPWAWRGFTENIQPRREALEARERVLMEVEHRGRNLMAVLQSLVALLPKDDPETFVASFESRLSALAAGYGLLTAHDGKGVRLHALLRQELSPYADRTAVAGIDTVVPARRVQDLGMVIHELATNSVKYGALSRPTGRVAIRSRAAPDGILLDWVESGGPPVRAPAHKGFGLTLLKACLSGAGDSLDLDWRPEGLCGRLRVGPDTSG